MLKAKDLDQFKAILLDLQSRMRGDVSALTNGALGSELDSKSPTHMAELGTETYEQDFSLRMMEGDQEVLDGIRAALKRIDDGTYGICEGCREEGKADSKAAIPKMRLKIIPHARFCVACAEKVQRQFTY
jgi:DnaK suppressor protein